MEEPGSRQARFCEMHSLSSISCEVATICNVLREARAVKVTAIGSRSCAASAARKPTKPFNVLEFKQACPCGPVGRARVCHAASLFRAWYRHEIARLTAFLVAHKHFEAPLGCHDIPLPQGGIAPRTLDLFFPQIVRGERLCLPAARICDELIGAATRLVYPSAPLFLR